MPTNFEKPAILKDSEGNELSRQTVEDYAFGAIMSSMDKKDLVQYYINFIDDDELVEWASSENGVFSYYDET